MKNYYFINYYLRPVIKNYYNESLLKKIITIINYLKLTQLLIL